MVSRPTAYTNVNMYGIPIQLAPVDHANLIILFPIRRGSGIHKTNVTFPIKAIRFGTSIGGFEIGGLPSSNPSADVKLAGRHHPILSRSFSVVAPA